MISTSCEACVFATWDQDTQKGCKLDKITKLVENGATLSTETSGSKNYYQINDRVCTTCRNKDWGNNIPRRKWVETVYKEVEFEFDIIIYCDAESNIGGIELTIDSVLEQSITPKSIIIGIEYDYHASSVEFVVDLVKNKSDIPWQVEYLTEESFPLNDLVKSVKSKFYTVFSAGSTLPENFTSKLNAALNEDMLQFLAIEPDDNNNGMVVQTKIHNLLYGNKGGFILDKIKFLAEEQDKKSVIRKFEQL